MNYRFECTCGKKLQAEENDLGEEIRCPDCRARILLPFKAEDSPCFIRREPLARIALFIGLLPVVLILYGAVETMFYGRENSLGVAFNIIGSLLWLLQVPAIVIGAISLKRIKKAAAAGGHLEGEREATAAVILGSVWLALFLRFLLFYLVGV